MMAEVLDGPLDLLDNEELRSRLHKEIAALKVTLVEVDKDNTKSVDIINKHSRNVSDVLQTIIDKKQDDRQLLCHQNTTNVGFPDPIHDLLSVRPLTRVEIPLDVIRMMITAGFSVNYSNSNSDTCLYLAIECHHYNVVRLLLNHSACCRRVKLGLNHKYVFDDRHPIVLLALHQNAPLDLFDMLATPNNLSEALCTALSARRTETVLHLITLGARVDTPHSDSHLPIDHFVAQYTEYKNAFNAELFKCLLPSRTKGEYILRSICVLLKKAKHDNVLQMLQQLTQRLDFTSSIKVFINQNDRTFCMTNTMITLTINDDDVCRQHWEFKLLLVPYLCSLILTELQFDVLSTPTDIVPRLSQPLTLPDELKARAQAVDDLWRTYRQKCKVKSLLRLCILRIRNSMSSLADDGFLTLPVPPYINKLLTYTDVAERIYEEWCKGIT